MEVQGIQSVVGDTFINLYQMITNSVPPQYKIFFDLLSISLLIILYSIFMWEACKFIGKRDILELNLEKYGNRKKSFAGFFSPIFFLLEYIIILPSVVFFWFLILAFSLLLLSESPNVTQTIIFAAALVVATRIAAYYSEDLSNNLSQLFPFTLLFYFLINPVFIGVDELLRRMFEIPPLINHIFIYLLFIFVIEVLLRTFFTINLISKKENIEY